MIRVERDPQFWFDVVSHPEVAALLGTTTFEQITALVEMPGVTPLASEHGGFFFKACDSFGRVCELHSLFKPQAWGREVHDAGIEALKRIFFEDGFQVVVTYEQEANRRSRPPRSFGFVALGAFEPSLFGSVRSWLLTRSAFMSSPAGSRLCL